MLVDAFESALLSACTPISRPHVTRARDLSGLCLGRSHARLYDRILIFALQASDLTNSLAVYALILSSPMHCRCLAYYHFGCRSWDW